LVCFKREAMDLMTDVGGVIEEIITLSRARQGIPRDAQGIAGTLTG
jgi:hypothetical protein